MDIFGYFKSLLESIAWSTYESVCSWLLINNFMLTYPIWPVRNNVDILLHGSTEVRLTRDSQSLAFPIVRWPRKHLFGIRRSFARIGGFLETKTALSKRNPLGDRSAPFKKEIFYGLKC